MVLAILLALVSFSPTSAQDRLFVPPVSSCRSRRVARRRLARIIAEPLSEALKQSVVIENRGGSGGMIAAQQVARDERGHHPGRRSGAQIISPSLPLIPASTR